MADTHSYFYSTDTNKQTLHRRIVPNQTQIEKQQERWNDLCEYLVDILNEKTGLSIASWLQGSYKFHTQVRPKNKKEEFDIDLGVYFKWNGSRDDSEYSPLDLKRMVQDCLVEYAKETEDATVVLDPPKDRCNRISFTEGFHIDVPVYHLDESTDTRSLATEKSTWENSDPKAIYIWFASLFPEKDTDQVRRLIRYFKIWSVLNLDNPPSSILLTVLVAEAYIQLSPEKTAGDDVALVNVSKLIQDQLATSYSVPNPVDT